jgi:hypothetical protein
MPKPKLFTAKEIDSSFLLDEKKIHPAIQYLNYLRSAPPSIPLSRFLLLFSTPKSIDTETFITGIKLFIKLANSSPLDESSDDGRKAIWGNIFSGLHYANDLATLWHLKYPAETPLSSSRVLTYVPTSWDSVIQEEGFKALIYKGHKPAEALDELLKGPTAIECGMFAQLSLWFGIRYMLGNERFNECFGRAPFYVTQMVYQRIEDSMTPWLGNPLFSFLSTAEKPTEPSIILKHVANVLLYRLKHPGGGYGGQNCILIGGKYNVFDPHSLETVGLDEAQVLEALYEGFNSDRGASDEERLALYAKTPMTIHPYFWRTYAELIAVADSLRDTKFTEEEFRAAEREDYPELVFDFNKFLAWLGRMEKPIEVGEYTPVAIDASILPLALLEVIPFENKRSMDFGVFKHDNTQQKELRAISIAFCHSVIRAESNLVILTGKAGVGKTAAAVCAAKELVARGKKVIWISEVMVKGWASRAKSMAELSKCEDKIDALLSSKPDAVFLDDDNLAGFSGRLLLEKMYQWYVTNPGKGLFITSNEPVIFTDCYGYRLDRSYQFPPFSDYTSSAYINWCQKTGLSGKSLRSKREGQSIGAIISPLAYQNNKSTLGAVELIPSIDDSHDLAPIRRSLKSNGTMGPHYDGLSRLQKRWIHVRELEPRPTYSFCVARGWTTNVRLFEKTTCKTIALEIGECDLEWIGKKISSSSMDQLIRVLNYAHDQGGKRVILINKTSFSPTELLTQIKAQLPESEQERTWSRLQLLLSETEDTIFGIREKSLSQEILLYVPSPGIYYSLLEPIKEAYHLSRYSTTESKPTISHCPAVAGNPGGEPDRGGSNVCCADDDRARPTKEIVRRGNIRFFRDIPADRVRDSSAITFFLYNESCSRGKY